MGFHFPITFLLILMNMVKVYWYYISICYIIFFHSCAIYNVCPLLWRSHSSSQIHFTTMDAFFFFFTPLLKCVSDLIKCLRKLCSLFKHNWLHKQRYPVIYWPKLPQFPICYLLLILRKFKTISIDPIMDVPLNVKKLN